MTDIPILSTKLHPPLLPARVVPRSDLLAKVAQAGQCRCLLVSAPAGFGKTTLLTAWLRCCEHSAAWVTLETAENDPHRFLTYVLAALAPCLPADLPAALHTRLQTTPEPYEPVLAALINEMSLRREPLLLVLDDYHTITAPSVHAAVTYLVDHAPPTLQLVLLTRADPPLPLPRWRVGGQLCDLRAADLRFSLAETTAFLNQMMGLALSAEDIHRLHGRIEGWIAGLQLAALSMRGRGDKSAFIATFSGSHHYIIDYLTDEVLNHQPEAIRTFLLHSSVLDRLCADLCTAVTNQPDSQDTLTYLERQNLFLLPLDDTRRWYRYHPLFASMLRSRLQASQPGVIITLQQRAAAWHVNKGLIPEAINLYLAAGDVEAAARLICHHWAALLADNPMDQNAAWLHMFPADLVYKAPRLGLIQAMVAWGMGKVDAAADSVAMAGRMMAQLASRPLPATSAEDRTFYEVYSRIMGSFVATARGEYETAVAAAQQVTTMPDPGDTMALTVGYTALCYAYLEAGEVTAAAAAAQTCLELAAADGNPALLANAVRDYGTALYLQGHLSAAEGLYRRYLAEEALASSPPFSVIHIALAELLLDQHQLEAAAAALEMGRATAADAGFFVNLLLAGVQQARLLSARGDPVAALAALRVLAEQARADGVTLFLPPVLAYLARLAAELGDHAAAEVWLPPIMWHGYGRLGYEQAQVVVQAAYTLLRRGQTEDVLIRAAQLKKVAADQGCRRWLLEADILQALAWQKAGKPGPALTALEQALYRPETAVIRQPFLDGGPVMRDLLQRLTAANPAVVRRPGVAALLAAFGTAPAARTGITATLSDREREVLALVAAGASNQQIAADLYLAPGTVKKHLNNIFSKLGVRSRTQAVARARESSLL